MEWEKILGEPPTVQHVIDLIATLRGEKGCPWDRKQTPHTLAVYLIEEAYELVEAITAGDANAVCEEMGDVLFQVMFIAALFQEAGHFDLQDVLRLNLSKMVRRHPHVFGSDQIETAVDVKKRWREIKQQEKGKPDSLMDSVPSGMPALMRAYRISERAAAAGFDWDDLQGVLAQTEAEWTEFKDEMAKLASDAEADRNAAALEFGDLLFTMVNVARLARLHPETALISSTEKFIRRFKAMEAMAAVTQRSVDQVPRDELERLWQTAKREETK